MPIIDDDGVAHHGYAVNDGYGDPSYLAAACQYLGMVRGVDGPLREWKLTDVVAVPVRCLNCLGMTGGFADGHTRFR